jgi:site-specific DNA-methyltransferase (adenine-specific)
MTLAAHSILTGDCRVRMPVHGPFDMIFADPPYGDTSLAWDRRVDGRLPLAMARKAADRIASLLPLSQGDRP